MELEFNKEIHKEYYKNPLELKEFETFEESTGYKLPESYKQFLIKKNGGLIKIEYEIDGEEARLTHKVTLYDGETIYLTLTQFNKFPRFDSEEGINRYSIYDEKGDENYKYSNPYEIEEYGHYGIQLNIGEGYNGDDIITLCLSPEENYGKIYAFNQHGDYNDPEKNCAKISDSFEEFMNTFVIIKKSEM